MKINQPQIAKRDLEQRLEEVSQLIEALELKGDRPCPGCTRICSRCASTQCNCECSYSCPQAATQLSSEKDRYPIEQKVLPLVYTLRAMNHCEPCWSCEGHLDEEQQIEKIPQVWFYTRSMSFIRLLDESLGVFKAKKMLRYTWQIALSYASRDCLVNAFSIKPDLNIEKSGLDNMRSESSLKVIDLVALQQDLKIIADHLSDDLLARSKAYQRHLQRINQDKNLLVKIG